MLMMKLITPPVQALHTRLATYHASRRQYYSALQSPSLTYTGTLMEVVGIEVVRRFLCVEVDRRFLGLRDDDGDDRADKQR